MDGAGLTAELARGGVQPFGGRVADTGAPIRIGRQILENGKAIAKRDGMDELLPKFDKAMSELDQYERNGHKTLDDSANRIIFGPFRGHHELEEEAMSDVDDSWAVVPKGAGPG